MSDAFNDRRRTRPRIVAAVISAITVTALLSACSTADSGGTDADTLTVAWNSIERAGMEAAVEAFEKLHPDLTIDATYADIEPYQAALRTELASGTASDVFYAWPGNGNAGAIDNLAPNGYLEDLSDQPYVAAIPEGIASYSQVDGKTYMVPLSYSAIGMIFNMTTLEESGLTVPTTYSEVLDYCADAAAAGYVPFDLGAGDVFAIMVPYALTATTVYSTDPDFDEQRKAGETTFADDPGFNSALDKQVEMNDAGCFGPSPTGVSFADSVTSLANGDSLATVNITAVFAQFTTAAPDAELVIYAMPATDDTEQTQMSGGPGAGPAINAASTKKELAQQFVSYLASPEGQKVYTEAGGQLPALIDDSYEPPANMAAAIDYLKAGKVGPLLDQNWPNAQVQNALIQQVQLMLNGTATPQDVLQAMDVAYDKG